jgi:hypothetical protein
MGFMSDSYKGHSAKYRTPTQQKNVEMRQAEDNRYAYNASMKRTTSTPKSNLMPPAGPSMHSAVGANKRQFGRVGAAVKSTMSRMRTLRRGR